MKQNLKSWEYLSLVCTPSWGGKWRWRQEIPGGWLLRLKCREKTTASFSDPSVHCVICGRPTCTRPLTCGASVHRHMPLEDALVLVAEEFRRFFTKREQQERAEISQRASDLVDDFLAREHLPSYSVPLGIRHLFFLLNEGKYLYRAELNLIIDYLKTRKEQLKGFEMPAPLASSEHSSNQGRRPPILATPPPLLPTPGKKSFPGPALPAINKPSLLGDRPGGGLLPLPGLNNPEVLLPPPVLQLVPSKRPAPLVFSSLKAAKRPLLGKKPGLLPLPQVFVQLVPHK
ncbi:uncharacterized protein LOC143659426 isoform X7 [Tamandua tetradactyla]|uniref:uncharacterized protein LOC143659426 isoform X7 n=1 Tax=Tamandua tetradactyla TaxID=48850 RepID=UPI00405393F2